MEQWATVVNDSSYAFDQVLPYYKRSVHFTPPNTKTRFANATTGFDAAAYDSQGGPLEVSYANYAMPFSTWMSRGMEAIGINETQEFNLGSLMGAQYCASTISPKNELRSSSQASFLASIKAPSLTTYSSTLAKKVLFDKNKKATGIRVKGPLGNTFTLSAKREVIISAGAFQSPQLLMVSGIGPKDILEQHNIEVLANRPGVGQNMWDHPFFAPSYRVTVDTFTKIATNLVNLVKDFLNSSIMKSGPLTNPVADYLAWEKIPDSLRSKFTSQTLKDLATFTSDWPEAEVFSSIATSTLLMFTNIIDIVYLRGRLHGGCLQPLDRPTQRWISIRFHPGCPHHPYITRKHHTEISRYIRPTDYQSQLARYDVRPGSRSGNVQAYPPGVPERSHGTRCHR